MVTASAATRRRNMAAKKNDGNVTKRGLVEDESIQRRKNKLPLGPIAIGFFLFVVLGSSILQILNKTGGES